MKTPGRFAVAALVLLASLAGCSHGEKGDPLAFAELPIAVRRGVEKAYPDAKVNTVHRVEDEKTGAVSYRVKLITRKGEAREDLFAPDGEKIVKESRW